MSRPIEAYPRGLRLNVPFTVAPYEAYTDEAMIPDRPEDAQIYTEGSFASDRKQFDVAPAIVVGDEHDNDLSNPQSARSAFAVLAHLALIAPEHTEGGRDLETHKITRAVEPDHAEHDDCVQAWRDRS